MLINPGSCHHVFPDRIVNVHCPRTHGGRMTFVKRPDGVRIAVIIVILYYTTVKIGVLCFLFLLSAVSTVRVIINRKRAQTIKLYVYTMVIYRHVPPLSLHLHSPRNLFFLMVIFVYFNILKKKIVGNNYNYKCPPEIFS